MLTKFYSLEDFAREVGETVEVLNEKRRNGGFFRKHPAKSSVN